MDIKKPNYLVLILCLMYYVNCGDETIDNTSPTISIVSHISGQSVDDTTTIMVSTKDKSGIGSVEFFINDSLYFIDSKIFNIVNLCFICITCVCLCYIRFFEL